MTSIYKDRGREEWRKRERRGEKGRRAPHPYPHFWLCTHWAPFLLFLSDGEMPHPDAFMAR